jgi:group II intron reverse transcriptase/maturase
MATKLVIEPIFEADFRPYSWGFRPRRGATQAMEVIREAGNHGHNMVLDADIRNYFGSIDHGKLMVLVKERICDRRVLKLIGQWLAAGVMEDGTVRETLSGTPQGGVISPLLSNIYLGYLDRIWENRCKHLGTLVRYADDCAPRAHLNIECGAVQEMREGPSKPTYRRRLQTAPSCVG